MRRVAVLGLLALAALVVAALIFAPYGKVEPLEPVVPITPGAVPSLPSAVPPPPPPPLPVPEPEPEPERVRSPEAEAHLEASRARQASRRQPVARRLAIQQSSWNAIHYELARRGTPEALALAEEIAPLVVELQGAFLSPERADQVRLGVLQDDMRRRIESSGLVDPALRAQLSRLDTANAATPDE